MALSCTGLLAHLRQNLQRDPGRWLLVLALVATAAVYASTLGYGMVNYDDPWLYRDNWVVQQPSWASVKMIFGEFSLDRRMVLGAEYLPIRDLSVMLDYLVWGRWYGGFHLTNLLLYLAAIALWFKALEGFGIDRFVCGLAVLLWAVHPTHVESVAWLAERKGLLAMAWAGASTLAYARYRAGRTAWLALAIGCALCAVWSKAHGAFAIGALVGLEWALPQRRQSWRRSLVGLAAIGAVAAAAFVPVTLLASSASVIGSETAGHGRGPGVILGTHGFYLEQWLLVARSSVSFPISTSGPSAIDIVVGALGLLAACAGLVVPRRGSPRALGGELRAASAWWLLGWLPISHAIVTLQAMVAERYLLVPSLGLALAIAFGISRIPRTWARRTVIAVLVIASVLRTLEARASWRDNEALWLNAVDVNPADGGAWNMYSETLADAGDAERASLAVDEGLRHSQAPRLVMRKALIVLPTDRAAGLALMREAADANEYRAMSNLALLLLADHELPTALAWARRSVTIAPLYPAGQRALGKIALEAQLPGEALVAFQHAYALEPRSLANRFNLGLALLALHRDADARPHLEACLADPQLGSRARALLK